MLMCSSDKSVKGGINSVVTQLMNHDWGDDIEMSYLSTHINGNVFKKSMFFVKSYIQLHSLLLKNSFDIIHIHMSYKGSFKRKYMVAKACKRFDKKVIIHLHGSEFKDYYNTGNDRLKSKIKNLFQSVDNVIVLGENWKEFILKIVPNARVTVVNNAVTIPEIEDKKREEICKILFLGMLIERKGVIDLLQATKNLKNNGIDKFEVLIAGTGAEEKRLKEFCEGNNLNDVVKFLGWIDKEEKVKLLETSDILVLPSYNEGLPVAILEAMSYGLPIISTKVGSIDEAVKDGVNGYLIEPGDVEDMERVICGLIENVELWTEYSEMSRNIVKDQFAEEEFIARIMHNYLK